MSTEYQRFLASWPVVTFVACVIFSSGFLWANVAAQGDDLTNLKANLHDIDLKTRLATIEEKSARIPYLETKIDKLTDEIGELRALIAGLDNPRHPHR